MKMVQAIKEFVRGSKDMHKAADENLAAIKKTVEKLKASGKTFSLQLPHCEKRHAAE